jgi:hypothetical protein
MQTSTAPAPIFDPLTLATACTTVPAVTKGVCDICHAAPKRGYRRCWMCAHVSNQVSRPVALVLPISLYTVGDELWRVLRGYKDATAPTMRTRYQTQVVSLLAIFLANHGVCVGSVAGQGGRLSRRCLRPGSAVARTPWSTPCARPLPANRRC